jgi:hypothetical protein
MTAADPKRPTEVFFSYAHKDESFKDALLEALALLRNQGVISAWTDRDIDAGDEWAKAIDDNLERADVILLLVSNSFLASAYCYSKEMTRALERHEKGEARVIPIILRACDWTGAPFAKLQALPKDGKPISSWSNADEAYTDVATRLRKLLNKPPNAGRAT